MNTERKFMKIMAIWMGISLAISLGINFVMFTFLGDAAFPWNLVVIIGVFMLLARWIARRQMNMLNSAFKTEKLSYVCRNCSTIYKGERCPRCSSSGGRAVFEG